MLYAAGAAELGTLSTTVSVAATFALIATGFAGATLHCAPDMELSSHVTFTEPL